MIPFFEDADPNKEKIADLIKRQVPAAKKLIIQEVPSLQQLLLPAVTGSKVIVPL